MTTGWEFWIDRGGTFTDIVAKSPDGKIIVKKLLSENPQQYSDAPQEGIRRILGISPTETIPSEAIAEIKMGTTVATNALLEKKGEATVLVITKGFKDALRIAYQNRPDLFAREIILPEMLYSKVIEVEERYSATGEELIPVNREQISKDLTLAYQEGFRSCAIVLLHAYRYSQHEEIIAAIARQLNFTQVSVSHKVSPLIKLVTRGDTTVVDAYLSPILQRYIDQFISNLGKDTEDKLLFMQSNGGLVAAKNFQGKDSILSGPAGGIVGAVKTSLLAGYNKIVTFDMGGTSTDVGHYAGEYERSLANLVAGVRMCTPMMSIHTVAAGGGSLVYYEGGRYRVGPASAGANPGPAAYGKGGPLTITDCNVMVGKLQPEFFPQVLGKEGNSPLDVAIVKEKFKQLVEEIGDNRNEEEIASGFLAIAVAKMANAIKKISLEKGYDLSEYTLCSFGAAGGQHACLIASALGIPEIVIHPYGGVLSAYGIGLADIRVLREKTIEAPLSPAILPELESVWANLLAEATTELNQQGGGSQTRETILRIHLKYEGTDSALIVNFTSLAAAKAKFLAEYQQRYGFTIPDKPLVVEAVSLELIYPNDSVAISELNTETSKSSTPETIVKVYTANRWYDTPVYLREKLAPGVEITGPALIIEATGTNMVEPGWEAQINPQQYLILGKTQDNQQLKVTSNHLSTPDPVWLEIFNNLFRAIAEQMGTTLQNTSYSVNIKERLDFSCAIFDSRGQLVANAPHIPVHLGSMSESISSLIQTQGDHLQPGDVYLLNNPYNGGTHLPDLTVITPVFLENNSPDFYVASRGHHADIGGITPGSMPPTSTNITEEGVLIDHFPLVKAGIWQEQELRELLTHHPYPVRNLKQNIADLQAQIAANQKGVQELQKLVQHYGLEMVKAYMQHIQANAAECVRKAIAQLNNGEFSCQLDNGAQIKVNIEINQSDRTAKIDFTGTSPQLPDNFNAPTAVCKAAVLYVFRTLVNDDIPLNSGCLEPLEIIIPEQSMLNPQYPAAVVAGNVETSQIITDCLYGALKAMAASQGTMNNFTFGDDQYQYYETICGGSGAGPHFAGTDAIHSHMTNSRLTDPEVLELRFPVLVESFSIRPHSGGQGLYNGGNGVIRRLRFLRSMTGGILSSRRVIPSFGLEGGNPGLTGHNYLERSDGTVEELVGTTIITINQGDVVVIATPGGGGWGGLTSSTY
ncbi:MAG: 5-oxoprolinase [Gloeocapsa sp. DLM2.Bin57]|nr:MAG: 5-oxoprolinase [Gloeocapsa sp. DLM2.Bin57]